MNYNEILEKLELSRQEKEIDARNKAHDIITKLKEAGIDTVNISFDGAGDDGQINFIYFEPNDDIHNKIYWDDVEEWAYDVLDGTGVDWYNNSGGFGDIIINVKNNSYNFRVNQRIEDYELAASGEVEV